MRIVRATLRAVSCAVLSVSLTPVIRVWARFATRTRTLEPIADAIAGLADHDVYSAGDVTDTF